MTTCRAVPVLRRVAIAAVGLFTVTTSGCIHLHDARNATLASEAQSEFADFRKTSADPYSVMLRNQARMQKAGVEDRIRGADAVAEAAAIAAAHRSWGQVRDELRRRTTNLQSWRQELPPELDGLCPTDGLEDAIKAAKSDQAAALGLVKQTLDKQREAEARRVFFNESLRFVVEHAADGRDSLDSATLKEARDDVLKHEVQYLELDKDGTLKTTTSTVQETLPRDYLDRLQGGDVGGILRDFTVAQFDPKRQPGLTIVLLGIARDLSGSELDRLTLCAEYRKAREEMLAFPPTLALARTASSVFGPGTLLPPGEKVIDTFNRARSASNGEAIVQDAFLGLSGYLLVTTADADATNELRVGAESLNHEYSIRLSALNAREREAVVGRGLEGLRTYHDGGVTSEDVANLIRAAQAVATAVIAGGVY